MLAHAVPLIELFRADRRSLEIERKLMLENPSTKAQLDSSRDPYQALTSQRVDLAREPFLIYGRIVEPIAYTHFYKVQAGREGGVISACAMVHSSLEVFGSKQLNTYVNGSCVVMLWAPHLPHAVILGVVPDFMIAANDALGDRVVQGSRVGLQVDEYQKYAFQLPMDGGIVDWSAGRAGDQIHSGEWGAVTETGLMFFMDPFMFQVRVDEETGVFGFYSDQMLRVAGHNLELRSSGYERTDDDDEWEFNLIEGVCPGYLWEARGAFASGTGVSRNVGTSAAQLSTPYYSETEPSDDRQMPIWRYRKFMGYLGQGFKRTLFILPENPPTLETTPNPTQYIGVAEKQWGLDGFISERSAKGIILSKRILIPTPKKVVLEEHPSPVGDDASNYRQNGLHVPGDPHLVSDIGYPICEPTNLLQAAAFLDLYAHVFNWRGLHPFHYHEKDWYLPEESDFTFASDMADGNPPFNDLVGTGAYILAPCPFLFTVDHRYGEVMYYPNNSYFGLLDDGGVVLGDGYGSELRMTGGNFYITAPGDIYELAGKNIAQWAGHDWAARGNWNCSLVANKCNVWIKGDNKVEILGGNDVCGGVLIESKAPATQFETQTPIIDPPECYIAQSGGYRNDITAICDCGAGALGGSYLPPTLKEVYRICFYKGGPPGTAEFDVISFTGTDDVLGNNLTAFGVPHPIGTRGCVAEWAGTDDFKEGQEWTLTVTCDPNDVPDQTVGGILLRAKHSTIFNYGKNIELLLTKDGKNDGVMIFDCGRKGILIEHGDCIIRHMERQEVDIFWDTTAPSHNVIFESTPATKDSSCYFGPICTYTITCIKGNHDQPLHHARVSVSSSCGDDDDSVVVALPPPGSPLTPIGNRGFRWTPDVPVIVTGDSWIYELVQEFEPCINEFTCEGSLFSGHLWIDEGNLFVDGCINATERITTLDIMAAVDYRLLTPDQITTVTGIQTEIKEKKVKKLLDWAPDAREDLTTIKDNTKVIKLEFFFHNSWQHCTEPPWRLFETRWQQMARSQGGGVSWSESAVVGEDIVTTMPTRPWPGIQSWTFWPTLHRENVSMFDLSDNLSEDRASPYETPVNYNTPSSQIFQGNWKVIENPC